MIPLYARRYLPHALSATILGGVLFAWTTLYGQFERFLSVYGDLLRFRDCVIVNPIATPCFWGALAFLAAFAWSAALLARPSERQYRYLTHFLLFGVFFALAVLGYEAVEYYGFIDLGSASVSCAPGAMPLQTPCFTGFLFFLAAYCAARARSRFAATEILPQ